ncbi:MAG: membrane-bound O-acyltransferase family protein [Bacteroidetes bacterium]|nr:MAG: membrane-bound O-acyltransferase family protein [Bacteroidota bacterium]
MVFNSFVFLVFVALFFALLYPIRRQQNLQLRWGFLVLASFVFYGWWDWRFLFLILASGFIDFFAALGMRRCPSRKRLLLLLSLAGNIGSLAIFKYAGFLAGNIDQLLSLAGSSFRLSEHIPEFMLLLPVGISFYTFQSMSYSIDVYRGRLQPTGQVLHFFAYLSLFPQLVAGPIVRARDLIPQLRALRPTTETERWNGFRLIVIGFFKKLVLADNIAPMVNAGFANIHTTQHAGFWWIIMVGFAFQIYFDFSGYSDIARGLAKWMGLHFRLNFDHPYHARSLREFWTRWHISLSTWFRDYVYIPLGGSAKGPGPAHLFMWITMLVSGLWHGAAWTFVIWGALHACCLSVERLTKWPSLLRRFPGGGFVSLLLTQTFVLIGWVFFRAESGIDALHILQHMFRGGPGGFVLSPDIRNGLFWIGMALLIEVLCYFRIKPHRFLPAGMHRMAELFYVLLMLLACIYLRGEGDVFIYFQF